MASIQYAVSPSVSIFLSISDSLLYSIYDAAKELPLSKACDFDALTCGILPTLLPVARIFDRVNEIRPSSNAGALCIGMRSIGKT